MRGAGPGFVLSRAAAACLWPLFCPVVASEEPPERSATAASSVLLSKFVDDDGIVLHNGPVLQTQIIRTHPSGLYYALWWSVNVDGTGFNSDYGDEIDYSAGYSGAVGPVEIDAGLTYCDLYRLFGSVKDDAWVPYIEVSKPLSTGPWKLQPLLHLEVWNVKRGGALRDGGTRTKVGVRADREALGLTWTSRTSFFYEDGLFGYRPGATFEFQVAAAIQVRGLRLTFPSITVMTPLGSSDGRVTQAFLSMGVEGSF